MHNHVRRATSSDLDSAAQTLASAFDTYAWTRWALPNDGYSIRLEEVQRLYLAHALEHGLVLVDENVHAVAAFLPPDAPAPTERIRKRLTTLYGSRLTSLEQLELPDSPAGSWRLETVGVDPSYQGTGLGTAVIAGGLTQIDKRGDPVALETSDERNVRLYRRLGFISTATTALPDAPIVYSMYRPAHPQKQIPGDRRENVPR